MPLLIAVLLSSALGALALILDPKHNGERLEGLLWGLGVYVVLILPLSIYYARRDGSFRDNHRGWHEDE